MPGTVLLVVGCESAGCYLFATVWVGTPKSHPIEPGREPYQSSLAPRWCMCPCAIELSSRVPALSQKTALLLLAVFDQPVNLQRRVTCF